VSKSSTNSPRQKNARPGDCVDAVFEFFQVTRHDASVTSPFADETEHHGWHDPTTVDEYLGRIGRLEPRLAGEAVMVEVLPNAPARVADLGCGDGRLTALVLEARPTTAEVIAVDTSPPMLEKARLRFADDARVRVLEHDLVDDLAPLGGFDLVVSGFAIHHLEDARKQALFTEVARQLQPGGVFANLEVVESATPELHAIFRAAIGRAEDDPTDKLVSVETQLGWMRAAGLQQVDCLWRWRGFALLVGSAA
jgi:tRNA (cmo5U34)-methyltransferase